MTIEACSASDAELPVKSEFLEIEKIKENFASVINEFSKLNEEIEELRCKLNDKEKKAEEIVSVAILKFWQ